MESHFSDIKLPNIAIDIELSASLAPRPDLDVLAQEIGHEIGEILQELGIPGEPLVRIRITDEASGDAEWSLSVSIDGQPCRFPSEILQHVIHYVSDDDRYDTDLQTKGPASIHGLSLDQMSRFVRFVSTEIVKGSLPTMLTPDVTSVYREVLADHLQDTELPDVQWLQQTLRGVLSNRISVSDLPTVAQVVKVGLAEGRSPAAITEGLIAAMRPKTIEIHFPPAYLRELTLSAGESDRESFAMMRDGLFYELGSRYPSIRFVPSENLEPYSFQAKINHLTTLPWRGLRTTECLVNDTPDRLGLLRIRGRAAVNPANSSLCSFMQMKDKDLAESAGLTTWNHLGYLVLALSSVLRAHAFCYLDHTEVEKTLDQLAQAFPALVRAVQTPVAPGAQNEPDEDLDWDSWLGQPLDRAFKIPPVRVPPATLTNLTRVLRLLMKEEISIRNLRLILESVVAFGFEGAGHDSLGEDQSSPSTPDDEWFGDPVYLVSHVRARMKRYISHKYTRGGNTLVVFLLDHEIEAKLANPEMMATDAFLASLERDTRDRILAAVQAEMGNLPPTAQVPVVLTTSSVRPIFRELIAPQFPRIAVVCYQELSPDLNIQPVARIALN